MNFHPIAELFPMMAKPELEALARDIKANGLLEPIWTYDNMILDGRNRYAACVIAEVEPKFREWKDNKAGLLAFVISANLQRRHLSESQRAMIAAEVANMNVGRPPDNSANLPNISQAEAAEMFNVSERLIRDALVVQGNGVPELGELVRQDKVAVSAAAKIAGKPKEFQQAVVEKLKAGVKPIEAIRQVIGESYADEKLKVGEKKYRVVYADPPWKLGNTQVDGFVEQRDHYRVMSLDEICAMPIKEMVTDDAVLFLWVTSPILEDAFEVIATWGFKYKAQFVWDKVKHVMGHYNEDNPR